MSKLLILIEGKIKIFKITDNKYLTNNNLQNFNKYYLSLSIL